MNPDDIVSEGWYDKPTDWPENLKLPEGVDKSGQYYAYFRVYRNGRRAIQWFKRGTGDGTNDPVLTTSEDIVPAIKEKWEQDQREQGEAAGKKVRRKYPGTDPQTGLPATVTEYEDGSLSYDSSGAPAKPTGTTQQIEGTPLGNGQFDNERPVMVTRRQDGTIVESRPLTAAEEKQWRESRERSRNPGGKTDAEIAAEQKEREASEQRNRPSVTLTQDGTQAVVTYPDGRVETKPTGLQGKPDRVTLDGRIYERQPDGSYRDVTPPKPQTPANAPAYTVDWSKPGLGLVEYAASVRARTDLTDDQKKELITQAHQSATTTVSQAQGILATQTGQRDADITQRSQDVTRQNQLLSTAGSIFQNALSQAAQDTQFSSGPGAAKAAPFLMALGAAFLDSMGATREIPRVESGPAVQQMGAMGVPGAGVPNVASLLGPGPWGAPGAPAPGAPASELAQPTDTAPVLGSVDDSVTAGQAASIMANPAFRPAPPVLRPPVNPALIQTDPQAMAPPPMAPQPMVAPLLGAGPWQQPAAPNLPGAMPTVLGSAAGTYDPTGLNRELLAAGIDPGVVKLFGGIGA